MNHLLIIDDEAKLRQLTAKILQLEGYQVWEAQDCRDGLLKLQQHEIQVVLCDVKMPDGNGVDLCKTIKEKYPWIEIILLTAYGNIADGVKAIKNGAYDYLVKGDDNAKIIPLVDQAFQKIRLAQKIKVVVSKPGLASFESMLGQSPAYLAAVAMAQKVSKSSTNVLIHGETGTGKELFAQSIHQASTRSSHGFVAINCSAFGKDLLESAMFGHKAGAFTGASKDHKGLFEEANLGTLFLDEIGEMPLELQAKLLRVLESGEFLKVGESKPTKVDVRILAATHRDLSVLVKEGLFREDLFYRLSVFQIEVPALRDRMEDVGILAQYFIEYFSEKNAASVPQISPLYFKALQAHHWKGNVRELKNVVERSLILMEGNLLEPSVLPKFLDSLSPDSLVDMELASVEKIHIIKVLAYTQGNKTEAARLLHIGLTTLYRKLEEYGIGV